MKISLYIFPAILGILLIFPIFLVNHGLEIDSQEYTPDWFVIEGLVENPLNLTYAELREFPLISEVTTLRCVTTVTYNWTGVPLFYLLSMAKVIPGAYREVVFNATDGFSSSVRLETAMDPTSILAFEVNGTDLEQVTGFGSGYRVVFPCRWGYKWVQWINQIVVVDYDYKGNYERAGSDDEAIIPNCTMPSTYPPIQTFNVTLSEEYTVRALSNSSIDSFSFESDGRMAFNVSGPEETNRYFYVEFPKRLLASPYQVYADQNPIHYIQTEAERKVYLYFTYMPSIHQIEIHGVPESAVDVNQDGIVDISDLYALALAYSSEPDDPDWCPRCDINMDKLVDISDLYAVGLAYGKIFA